MTQAEASPLKSRGRSNRRSKSEQTERNIMSTATWLFSERGFHGTGIRDIADAAGVAVSAMYYYASSKDDLLEEIMRRSLTVLDDSGNAATGSVEGPAEQLAMLIGSHVVFHAKNPRAARVTDHEFGALQGPARKGILQQRDAYESLWAQVLDAGIKDGTFQDRGSTARLALLQMTTGIAHWYKPRGRLTVADLWRDFVTMGLSLMGAFRDGSLLTFEDLELPGHAELLGRAELDIEPRRRPPGL